MTLTVAVQMDPIDRINIAGDSTFALLLEAQARGHALLFYTPEMLSLHGGAVVAVTQPLTVRDQKGDHFTLGAPAVTSLASVDVVLLRQDPPFDLAYITSTHLLERIHPKTLVVNDPAGVRNAPEKLFVLDFPALMPPTLITRNRDAIEAFRAEHGDVVMKPLYGNGGAAVFKVSPRDPNFGSLFDLFSVTFREPWVVQRFLPAVVHGDKRIILVDGVPLGAVNRVPAQDDIRSNMVRGGAASATDLTPARAGDLRRHRPRVAAAGPPVHGDRRHRRQPHRDQRHLADGAARHQAARRPRHRRGDLGRHRGQAARLTMADPDPFAGRLLPRETLLWFDRPRQGAMLSARDGLLIPFSLVWCGFAVFWELQVLRSHAPAGMALFGVPFVFVGTFLVVGRFALDAWLRARTVYGLTDRRILILRDKPWPDFKAVALDRLPAATLSEHANGRGTIRFGAPAAALGGGWSAGGGVWIAALDPVPQFVAIADARRVFDRIQELVS